MAFFIQSYLMSDLNPLVIDIQAGSHTPGTLLDAYQRIVTSLRANLPDNQHNSRWRCYWKTV
jgi:hypothetical protein